jgi:hypothetical protein
MDSMSFYNLCPCRCEWAAAPRYQVHVDVHNDHGGEKPSTASSRGSRDSAVWCHRIKGTLITGSTTTTACMHLINLVLATFGSAMLWRMLCLLQLNLPRYGIPPGDQISNTESLSSLRPIVYTTCRNRHLTWCIGSVCLIGRLANRDSRWDTSFH